MKKYVLNIDKFYTGQTSNAIVLNQVDEDFPTLIQSVTLSNHSLIRDWIEKWKELYPDFFNFDIIRKLGINIGHRFTSLTQEKIDEINNYIVDFNLDLQEQFKKRGHDELYMMDDTQTMNPNDKDKSLVSEKTYLHCLNGKAFLSSENDENQVEVNSSQLNVLFPYKKISSKSLYASQLKVEKAADVDDILERSRGITLQGKVSYENCLQGVAQVGNNIYVMAPNIDIDEFNTHIHGNGLTVVNAFLNKPYHFPNSMTLFQPSQEQYDGANLATLPPVNFNDFIDWYERHSRRTVVRVNDTYGGNVSTFTCVGSGSYELNLATYSPTGIILTSADGQKETTIQLNSDTYRKIRAEDDPDHKYMDFTAEDGTKTKKYVFDNSKYDIENENGKLEFGAVGLMFNMFDTYIDGNDRILKMHIPKDTDFNRLLLRFDWEVRKSEGLLGDFEATVYVDENEVFCYNPDDIESDKNHGEYELEITDTAISDHDISIYVRIHHQIDFGKRNTEYEYREMLRNSGILLKDIRIENGV